MRLSKFNMGYIKFKVIVWLKKEEKGCETCRPSIKFIQHILWFKNFTWLPKIGHNPRSRGSPLFATLASSQKPPNLQNLQEELTKSTGYRKATPPPSSILWWDLSQYSKLRILHEWWIGRSVHSTTIASVLQIPTTTPPTTTPIIPNRREMGEVPWKWKYNYDRAIAHWCFKLIETESNLTFFFILYHFVTGGAVFLFVNLF